MERCVRYACARARACCGYAVASSHPKSNASCSIPSCTKYLIQSTRTPCCCSSSSSGSTASPWPPSSAPSPEFTRGHRPYDRVDTDCPSEVTLLVLRRGDGGSPGGRFMRRNSSVSSSGVRVEPAGERELSGRVKGGVLEGGVLRPEPLETPPAADGAALLPTAPSASAAPLGARSAALTKRPSAAAFSSKSGSMDSGVDMGLELASTWATAASNAAYWAI